MNEISIRCGVTEQGEVPLAYEDWGDEAHPPLLLIMGIGAQLCCGLTTSAAPWWPRDFG